MFERGGRIRGFVVFVEQPLGAGVPGRCRAGRHVYLAVPEFDRSTVADVFDMDQRDAPLEPLEQRDRIVARSDCLPDIEFDRQRVVGLIDQKFGRAPVAGLEGVELVVVVVIAQCEPTVREPVGECREPSRRFPNDRRVLEMAVVEIRDDNPIAVESRAGFGRSAVIVLERVDSGGLGDDFLEDGPCFVPRRLPEPCELDPVEVGLVDATKQRWKSPSSSRSVYNWIPVQTMSSAVARGE